MIIGGIIPNGKAVSLPTCGAPLITGHPGSGQGIIALMALVAAQSRA